MMKELMIKCLVIFLFSIFQVTTLSSQCQDWTITSYAKTDLGGGLFQYDVSFSFPAQGNFSAMITLKCLNQDIGGVPCTGSLSGQSTYDLTIGSSPIDCADEDIVIEIVKFNSPNCGSTCGTQILPVILNEFGMSQKSDMLDFYWSTLSEVNNEYFTIEESENGILYDVVDNIEATNKPSGSTYNYELNKESRSGLMYFRLSQTDFNGETNILKTISSNIFNNNHKSTLIYPNPGWDVINISSPYEVINVKIYNVNSKELMSFENSNRINISNFDKGLYVLKISTKNLNVETFRYVKQK